MTRLTEAQLQALPNEILFDSRAADTTRTEAHKALIAVEDEKATASRFWEWVTDHESQYPQLLWLTHNEKASVPASLTPLWTGRTLSQVIFLSAGQWN